MTSLLLEHKAQQCCLKPSAFKLMLVKLTTGGEQFVFLNVYRKLSLSIAEFYDQLCYLFDILGSLNCHVTIAGDFNSPGVTLDSYRWSP
jgi:endonuclease/exonuclease/phosphatase family metal-dependent hydrolase